MAVRTRAQLNSDADSSLPNNTTGEISPVDVRERIKDLADSARLEEDEGELASRDRASVDQHRSLSGDAALMADRLRSAAAVVSGVTQGAGGIDTDWGAFINGPKLAITA